MPAKMTGLLTNVGRLAEFCGLVPVLDSQTPRLPRRIFHDACASLIGAKEGQLNQRLVGMFHPER